VRSKAAGRPTFLLCANGAPFCRKEHTTCLYVLDAVCPFWTYSDKKSVTVTEQNKQSMNGACAPPHACVDVRHTAKKTTQLRGRLMSNPCPTITYSLIRRYVLNNKVDDLRDIFYRVQNEFPQRRAMPSQGLVWVCEHNPSVDMLRLACAYGGDGLYRCSRKLDKTALEVLVENEEVSSEHITVLLKECSTPVGGDNVVFNAIKHKVHPDVVCTLLSHSYVLTNHTQALALVCKSEHRHLFPLVLRLCIEFMGVDAPALHTQLLFSIYQKNAEVVSTMAAAGVPFVKDKVEVRSPKNCVICQICKSRSGEMHALLLRYGPQPFHVQRHANCGTCLTECIWRGSMEGLTFLLENGANPNEHTGRLPLCFAANRPKHEQQQVCEILLQYGADVSLVLKGGNTVFHHMIAREQVCLPIMVWLSHRGGDLRARNDKGFDVLQLAATWSKQELCIDLCREGFSPFVEVPGAPSAVRTCLSNRNMGAPTAARMICAYRKVPVSDHSVQVLCEELRKCTYAKVGLRFAYDCY